MLPSEETRRDTPESAKYLDREAAGQASSFVVPRHTVVVLPDDEREVLTEGCPVRRRARNQ
jgi:hypothetical protein